VEELPPHRRGGARPALQQRHPSSSFSLWRYEQRPSPNLNNARDILQGIGCQPNVDPDLMIPTNATEATCRKCLNATKEPVKGPRSAPADGP
jgi:hypothetical protein